MNSETEKPADQLEVNKVVRMLNGKPMKYTVHLLMKDGTERQVQTENLPKLDYNNEARALMIVVGVDSEYSHIPLAKWEEVCIMQCEKNP